MLGSGQPIVSVITPIYNRVRLVGQTLESLRSQTLPAWECLIVDDGSTDGSDLLIGGYVARDSRFFFFQRDRQPKGACTCRNLAVERANGKYLLFLDSDDIAAPHCLEQRVRYMETMPDLDFALFPMLLFREHPLDLRLLWNIDKDTDDLKRQLHLDTLCQGTGALWRKDSLISVGKWDESLQLWQDIDLFLRAFILRYKYKKHFNCRPDVFLRISDTSMSKTNFFERAKLESRARVVRKTVPLLRAEGREPWIRETRFMCAEIVLGSAASHNYDLARELTGWGYSEGVFNSREKALLNRVTSLSQMRLTRLAVIRRYKDKVASRFRSNLQITLGTERYEG